MSNRYDAACRAIDEANGDDPRKQEADGKTWPQEVLYSRRMVGWVERLAPNASEELLLACRAQHIRRWEVERSSYPDGRMGYLKWRKDLQRRHADTLGSIMKDAGYPEDSVAKAQQLILRKNNAKDPEGQALEDAACLVFLEFEFSAFVAKTEEAKVVDIVRKTWKKMSDRAREEAGKLSFGEREGAVIKAALA